MSSLARSRAVPPTEAQLTVSFAPHARPDAEAVCELASFVNMRVRAATLESRRRDNASLVVDLFRKSFLDA